VNPRESLAPCNSFSFHPPPTFWEISFLLILPPSVFQGSRELLRSTAIAVFNSPSRTGVSCSPSFQCLFFLLSSPSSILLHWWGHCLPTRLLDARPLLRALPVLSSISGPALVLIPPPGAVNLDPRPGDRQIVSSSRTASLCNYRNFSSGSAPFGFAVRCINRVPLLPSCSGLSAFFFHLLV